MNSPFLSIITVTLNNLNNLKKTISSVREQSFKDYEIIVIDGDSIDGTKDFLYENKELFSIFISEKDNGIYDAMNKGISIASGKYIQFLNAGDLYYKSDVLINIFTKTVNYDFDIIYGDTLVFSNNNFEVIKVPKELYYSFWIDSTICHQSHLIKKSLFFNIGYYNLDYKIIADYDFLFKVFLKNQFIFFHVDEIVSIYDNNGFSSRQENIILNQIEKNKCWKENIKNGDYLMFKRYIKINAKLKKNRYQIRNKYKFSSIILSIKILFKLLILNLLKKIFPMKKIFLRKLFILKKLILKSD